MSKAPHVCPGVIVLEFSYEFIRARTAAATFDIDLMKTAMSKMEDQRFVAGIRQDKLKWDDSVIVIESSFNNINHAFDLLYQYFQLKKGKNAGDATLKILTLSGEIGGRGVCYKTTDHKLHLTHMFYSFDVLSDRKISCHVESAIQAVGRCCTVVPALENALEWVRWDPYPVH